MTWASAPSTAGQQQQGIESIRKKWVWEEDGNIGIGMVIVMSVLLLDLQNVNGKNQRGPWKLSNVQILQLLFRVHKHTFHLPWATPQDSWFYHHHYLSTSHRRVNMAIRNHYFFPVPSFLSQSLLRKPSKNLDWGLRLWVWISLWICWKVIKRKLGLILGVMGLIETITRE